MWIVEKEKSMNTFNETGLAPELLHAIEDLGFETPTPVQQQTIPAILNFKSDLVALAQTGTGKTAAFGLPVLQLTDLNSKNVQTLVLCPTRELCMQITSDLEKYSKYIKGFQVVAIYGGANILAQIKAVKSGCHAVVGTPGRVLDLIRRKVLKLGAIRWLILDEADEMLNMGFKDDLDTILAETPAQRQTLLFSATMPKEIAEIATKYMKKPDEISIGKRNAGAENVRHEYYMAHARDRYLVLKRIVDMNPSVYGIVFCRTRIETKEVADKLMQDGYNADALHGDLSQAQRDYVMNRFRIKNLQLLVATDVAARGLDVNDLTHIINYNLPDDLDVYIHRSGRTGRAGKSGISITIIHTKERSKIKDLERMTRKSFEYKMVPGGRQICEKQLFNLVDRVEKTEVNDTQIDEYLPVIYKKLEWLSREELIKHFVAVEFNRFLEYYKDAPDLNVAHKEKPNRRDERTVKSYSRFHINLGSKNSLDAGGLISLINKHSRGQRVEIGKIDIMRNFSFFEVDNRSEENVKSVLRNATFKGVPVSIDLSKPDAKANFRTNDYSKKIRTNDYSKKRRKDNQDNSKKNKKRLNSYR
jgi:ATP-dependent RNA helicase DeaD